MKHLWIIETLALIASCAAPANAGPFDALLSQAKYAELTVGEVHFPEPESVDKLPAYNDHLENSGKLMVVSQLDHVPDYARDIALKEARKVVYDHDELFPQRGVYKVDVVMGEPYYVQSDLCDERGHVTETQKHNRPPSNWEAQQTASTTSSSMDGAWGRGSEVRTAYGGSAMMHSGMGSMSSYSMPVMRTRRGLFSRRASACVGGS